MGSASHLIKHVKFHQKNSTILHSLKEGRLSFGTASHLFQRQHTKCRVCNLHNMKDMEEDLKGTGYKYPSLKIAFGVF